MSSLDVADTTLTSLFANQKLHNCCYLFAVLNSGLLSYTICFPALAMPRSAISAVVELLFPPVIVNVHLWPWLRTLDVT